jgi:hypothetical protein
MKVDLAGKVKNTQLPRSKALLPMFEAVVNSFQSIEDAGETLRSPKIDIVVTRDPVLPGIEADTDVNGFKITDNGVGFNPINVDSFFTSDTQYKVGRGGKGIGRFIWLKAFDRAEIESHYRANGELLRTDFDFTLDRDQPPGPPTQSQENAPKTTVRLVDMKSPYKENCPLSLAVIGHRLIEHCLPFFLDPKCPAIAISDDRDRIDLNQYFRDNFAAKATQHTFKIGESSFILRGLRLYNPHETHHRLIYAANSREVFPEKLEKYLPNLQRTLADSDGGFAYLGFVEGDYLNQHVNGERTNFSFPVTPDATDELFDDITLDAIRNATLACVSEDLQPFLQEINTEKRTAINTYIAAEAPQYRPLARYMDEFIDRIPPGAKGLALDVALHEQMYQKQRALKSESHTLMEESTKAALKPEEYEAKVNDFLERANELGKSSLAQYVAHRKVILEFLEKSLQSNPETGKYPLEEIIHKIIYPMRTTSDDVPYEQQNLWIIDERLSYHGFLASDMPLNTASVLVNESDSRPDLMIFDRALTFAEDDAALNSLVIVEFKKPARTAYKEDPVDQVYRLIREIKTGHFKDRNGREIKVQSDRIPAYAYVICDTTAAIEVIAQNKGMLPTPDNLGYYVYNPALSAYVEIISYTKLLQDAKKRNRILFDKLHLPVNSP